MQTDPFFLLSLHFPHLFLLKSSKSLPFSTFVSFPRHPTMSPMQSPKPFPLHPTPQHILHPQLAIPLVQTVAWRVAPNGSWQWILCLDAGALLVQLWEGTRQGLLSSRSLIWVSSCPYAPLGLWRWTFHSSPVMGLGVAWPGNCLGSHPQCLSRLLRGGAPELYSNHWPGITAVSQPWNVTTFHQLSKL